MLHARSKQLVTTVAVTATTAALTLSFTGSAVAASNASATDTGNPYSSAFGYNQKVDQLANDLEVLFTRYIPRVDGKFTVNKANAIADGLQSEIQDFQTVADAFNAVQADGWKASVTPVYFGEMSALGAREFALCLLEVGLGIPASAFTTGTFSAIIAAVSAWNWGLAASTIARALGPAFVTGAGRALGGPVVIAGYLAAGAGICAWKQYS